MPKVTDALGARAVSLLMTPGLHAVGGVSGLSLQVKPSGARSWSLRTMVGGKRREIGLGGYPTVTLASAREKARQAREVIQAGKDPIHTRRAARSALLAAQASAVTFESCALACKKSLEPSWRNAKHGQQWINTLEAYVFPVIGDMLVADITKTHVLSILEPIWLTKNETATRVRGRIETVLDFATARGQRPEGLNPARLRGNLDKLLARSSKVAPVQHHKALPITEVGAFMHELRKVAGMGARALEFAILTAGRSGEVRGAKWAEIDLEQHHWTIPGARMKAGREHRVPLSSAAINLLKATPHIEGSDLVFTAPRGGQLSDMTLAAVLRRMKVAAVPHGFRSSFRDWAGERTHYPADLAEMALAHAIGNKVEAAYRRGDMLDKRRQMMEDWATFCSRPDIKGRVIEMNHRKA